jgi:hypothetical protein
VTKPRDPSFPEYVPSRRNKTEVTYYVGKLSRESFEDPSLAVHQIAHAHRIEPSKSTLSSRSTAQVGQVMHSSIATAAFDERTGKLVALAHGAKIVTSTLEPKLLKLGVPTRVAEEVGNFERQRKSDHHQETVWTNEIVYDERRAGLFPIMLTLQAGAYHDQSMKGIFFPKKEEVQLKADLTFAGYEWDGGERTLLVGEDGFGPDTESTYEERWETEWIGLIGNRLLQLDRVEFKQAVQQANESILSS